VGPNLYHFDQGVTGDVSEEGVGEEVGGGEGGFVIWGRPDLSPSIHPAPTHEPPPLHPSSLQHAFESQVLQSLLTPEP